MPDSFPVFLQCVYGDSNIHHLLDVFIPQLANSSTQPITLATVNYDGRSTIRLPSGIRDRITIIDVENTTNRKLGFAECNNIIFRAVNPTDFFILINPDCIPHKGSIDNLIQRYRASGDRTAVVEGRQWPFEHPKEYDPLSLETPWASGAFSLINTIFYRYIGGMDEIYTLYLEDVDLSWQAWLNGYKVLYEPSASITHFTSGIFYRDDLVTNEQYYSLRNFLTISRKFFGTSGEATALDMLNSLEDKELVTAAVADYKENIRNKVSDYYVGRGHLMVKILGVNRFHNLR